MQNETRLKRMSAVITLVLGALLLLAAWKPPEMIIWLNLLASLAGGQQLLPLHAARSLRDAARPKAR